MSDEVSSVDPESGDWEDVLAWFKQEESPEMIVPMMQDERLRNAIVAWQSVTIQRNYHDQCDVKGVVSRWNWLWSQVAYDKGTFGTVAGLKPQDVDPVMTRLIGLRLIYPDGEVNNFAKQYLQSLIMKELKGKRGPGRPKKDSSES